MDNNRSYRICASRAQMSRSDLEAAYAVQANLTVEKVCPMLVNQRLPLDLSVVTPIQPHKGMTMKVFSDIMMDQPYISSRFGNPKDWPFFFAGAGAARADAVGFLSIPRNGDALWGISCPEGAIVVSEAQTLPHCLHIGASPTQENFSSFSGSVTCPPGTAISGWYNLPGIPVKRSEEEDKGGPKDWTGLLVFCRKTNLLASCVQPEKPHCPAGHAVNSVSYSGNQFKLGCCRLQKPLGTTLSPNPRKAKQYQPFEGYYCPTAMGTTGSAVYEKSPIGIPAATDTDTNVSARVCCVCSCWSFTLCLLHVCLTCVCLCLCLRLCLCVSVPLSLCLSLNYCVCARVCACLTFSYPAGPCPE